MGERSGERPGPHRGRIWEVAGASCKELLKASRAAPARTLHVARAFRWGADERV